MRLARAVLWVLLGFMVMLFFGRVVYPHGGGLDGYGCHHDRKRGGYHCHRGPFAGQSFSSQQEMLQRLKEQPSKETKGRKE